MYSSNWLDSYLYAQQQNTARDQNPAVAFYGGLNPGIPHNEEQKPAVAYYEEQNRAVAYNQEQNTPALPGFREGYFSEQNYINMSHNFLYDNQLQMPIIPRTASPAPSTASGSYRFTPSPDVGPSVSQAASPVPMFVNYPTPFAPLTVPRSLSFYDAMRYNPYLDSSPSRHSNISSASPSSSMFSGGSISNLSVDGRMSSLSSDAGMSTISVASDSGVSTLIDEANVVEPPEPIEEVRVHPQLAGLYHEELDLLACRSILKKTRFMREFMEDIPEEPAAGAKPRKSRLRKQYDTPEQIAERERNNAASKRSRNKKKVIDEITRAEIDFQRSENADLVGMRKYMSGVIYSLEEKLMAQGSTKDDIRKLRSACGIPFYDPQEAFEAMIPL